MLLLDLGVHGARLRPKRSVWAAVQVALALVAMAARPEIAASLVVTAVLAGVSVAGPWVLALVCVAVAAGVTFWVVDTSVSMLVSVVGAYVLAATVGRLFYLRSEEAH